MKLPQLKRRSGDKTQSVFEAMATLVLGTGIARLIGVISMPVISRLYTPEDFGVLAIFISIIGVLVPIATLRYVLAIPLPRRDGSAINLLVFSGFVLLFMSSLSALMLWICSEYLFVLFSMQQLSPYWWLIVLGLIGSAAYEMLSLWATRKCSYKTIARATALQSLLGNLTKIGLGPLAAGPFGLLIGQVVATGGGTISFWKQFRANFKQHYQHITLRRMGIVAIRYRHFPAYRLPSQLLLVFSVQAPAILSAALYGTAATGQLGLALMVLAVPASLVGQAAGQAFYGEIARLEKGSALRIKELAYAVQKRLFVLGIPVTAGIFFLAEPVFPMVFGRQWVSAGTYVSTLAPFVLLQLTSAPLIQILNIYDAQKIFLAINIFRAIGLLGIYWVCKSFALETIRFVQIFGTFLFLFYFLVTLYILFIVNGEATKKMASIKDQETLW